MRPSQLIDITDPYTAYCFDDACYMWAAHVERAVYEAGKKIKNQAQRELVQSMTLKALLREPEEATPAAFSDPAAKFKKS